MRLSYEIMMANTAVVRWNGLSVFVCLCFVGKTFEILLTAVVFVEKSTKKVTMQCLYTYKSFILHIYAYLHII